MIETPWALACPIALRRHPTVTMAHGGGGRLMNDLVGQLFLAAFGTDDAATRHDGAVLEPPSGRLAMTTDSFVVRPLSFPGGEIGSLAVHGTVNDLAMCGARPLYLTAGFILEEGLGLETLWQQALAMRRACDRAGVRVVTGDTKVVERGKGDGLYVNTAGVGVVAEGVRIAPSRIQPDDAVLISGDLGRHGIAVMSAREGLRFESPIESDSAPVVEPVLALIDAGIDVHCLRDLTRGGFATALAELAEAARVEIEIDEPAVPVVDPVRGACEILGLDPLYVANEGRFVAFVASTDADRAVEVLRRHAVSRGALAVGHVRAATGRASVMAHNAYGTARVLDMLSGEQLPRIC
jgi:hydrogenase expression/formation protein HypE